MEALKKLSWKRQHWQEKSFCRVTKRERLEKQHPRKKWNRQQSRQSNPEANLKPPGQVISVEGIHPELARHGTASSLGTEQLYTGTDLKAATMDEVLHYRALV
ncbi:hypothetical protein quinque_013863 [Culex quinquefasciatus]